MKLYSKKLYGNEALAAEIKLLNRELKNLKFFEGELIKKKSTLLDKTDINSINIEKNAVSFLATIFNSLSIYFKKQFKKLNFWIKNKTSVLFRVFIFEIFIGYLKWKTLEVSYKYLAYQFTKNKKVKIPT